MTKQSFRRHLTKRNDADEESDSIAEDPHPATARSPLDSYAYRDHIASNQRSLQAPSHIFRSFGLFTAVVTP